VVGLVQPHSVNASVALLAKSVLLTQQASCHVLLVAIVREELLALQIPTLP
jgi:hypothetical protein